MEVLPAGPVGVEQIVGFQISDIDQVVKTIKSGGQHVTTPTSQWGDGMPGNACSSQRLQGGEALHGYNCGKGIPFPCELQGGIPVKKRFFRRFPEAGGESPSPLGRNGLMWSVAHTKRFSDPPGPHLAGACPFRRGKGRVGCAAARRGGRMATTAPGAGVRAGRSAGDAGHPPRQACGWRKGRQSSRQRRSFAPSAGRGP